VLPYASPIEHLDELIGLGLRLLAGRGRPGRPPDDDAIAASIAGMAGRQQASRDHGVALPWSLLVDRLELTATEQMVLALVVALELDGRARRAMRQQTEDPARIWPDVGLLADCVYRSAADRVRMIQELSPTGTLCRYRLLDSVGSQRQVEDAPFAARPLRAARRVLELLHGNVALDHEVAMFAALETEGPGLPELIVPDEAKRQFGELLRAPRARSQPGPVIVLAGHDGSGRIALARATAASAGSPILRIRCGELPADPRELARSGQAILRDALLFDALPVLDGIDELVREGDPSGLDRLRVLDRTVLDAFSGAVVATALPSDRSHARFQRGSVVIEIPMPSEEDRRRAWSRALGPGVESGHCDDAAARYYLSPGMIARAAASARELARARGGDLQNGDVHAGVRSVLDAKLSTLGVRVTWRQRWDDLVLPSEIVDEIREFLGRVRHRKLVYDQWGFARKVAKGLGLSALFSGPPGTGKTMVAGIIADELGLDLYQIDLARIVSKYVGETEKNLSQVFDAAEAGHAILLFDEADSLFAKRTDIKSSIDRYANLEVNYLLQRMETFRGISILTTNNDSAIDDAFRRRLSIRVDFAMPEPDERDRLWRSMLPAEATLSPDVDDNLFSGLANKYVMSGGYIRNATLRAAFLAAEEGGCITPRHLQRAAALEYAAMGKVMNWS
jgi:AAA+ superfamily predicted ATPase